MKKKENAINTKIIVTNLKQDIDIKHVEKAFQQFGEILELTLKPQIGTAFIV
jgi:hypothetical protein